MKVSWEKALKVDSKYPVLVCARCDEISRAARTGKNTIRHFIVCESDDAGAVARWLFEKARH
jgi:hypothetical protein